MIPDMKKNQTIEAKKISSTCNTKMMNENLIICFNKKLQQKILLLPNRIKKSPDHKGEYKKGYKTHRECDRHVKSAVWFVSRSSLEATASKPAHPRRSSPPQAAVPICLPPPSLWQGRSQWPSVFTLHVCMWNRKGQEKEKLDKRGAVTDSLEHLLRPWSLWTGG